MVDCDICEMLNQKDAFKVIFEDEEIVAMLHEAPAFIGHTIIVPKKHFRIIEELPDDLTGHIFNTSNLISSALFETMNISGTNIIVNNGPDAGQVHPHVIVDVIPRNDNDGLNFDWPMQQADPAQLDSTQELLAGFIEKAILGSDEIKTIEEKEVIIESSEDDYMIKQLRRMP